MSSIVRNYKTKVGVKYDCLNVVTSSHVEDSTTALRVRRVKPEQQPEHVQVEVVIERHGPKRTSSYHGFICLDPNEAKALVTALTKVHPPHKKGSKLDTLTADSDKAWAEFYELDPKTAARFL